MVNSVGQNCEVATAISESQIKVAGGSATVHYDGTSKFKGGQAVYVKIKNENVLGVSCVQVCHKIHRPR